MRRVQWTPSRDLQSAGLRPQHCRFLAVPVYTSPVTTKLPRNQATPDNIVPRLFFGVRAGSNAVGDDSVHVAPSVEVIVTPRCTASGPSTVPIATNRPAPYATPRRLDEASCGRQNLPVHTSTWLGGLMKTWVHDVPSVDVHTAD